MADLDGKYDNVAPRRESKEDWKLGWLIEAKQEAARHLQGQRGYKDMKLAMDLIAGDEPDDIPPELSKVYVNRLKRQMREVIAVESQINPSWYYESVDPAHHEIAQINNELLRSWWTTGFVDLKLRECNQYAVGMGTGWLQPWWSLGRGRYGAGKIDLAVYGPSDVSMIQPTRDNDIQRAYGVIISKEVPINLARAMYPEKAHLIQPDKDAASYSGRSRAMGLIEKTARMFGSPVMQMFGANSPMKTKMAPTPTVTIHDLYLMDNSINQTGTEVRMGREGTTWSYTVPSLRQEMETNIPDPMRPGRMTYRKADFNDCLLYPMRRLIVFTETACLEDDTSPYWHGKVPLVKFVNDDWPWEFLGYGMMLDGGPLNREINQVLRGFGDLVNLKLRPPLLYDENAVSDRNMSRWDPRVPGSRMRANLGLNPDPVKAALPPELYRVGPETVQYLQMLLEMQDHQSAVTDFRNLAKAKQIPSDSTIDKILELGGPLVQDMTRTRERPIKELGDMILPMQFQFYRKKRKFPIVGQDGQTLQHFDFDPEDLIPPELKPEVSAQLTAQPKWERLREFTENFQMIVVPNSLHEATQTTYKLMLFQLWRDGRFPIDPWTIAEAFKLRNFGPPPKGTIYERHQQWLADSTQFQATLQAMAQLRMASLGLGALMGGGMGGGEANGQGNQGRPPSGQEPPKIRQKDGGTRSTISESG